MLEHHGGAKRLGVFSARLRAQPDRYCTLGCRWSCARARKRWVVCCMKAWIQHRRSGACCRRCSRPSSTSRFSTLRTRCAARRVCVCLLWICDTSSNALRAWQGFASGDVDRDAFAVRQVRACVCFGVPGSPSFQIVHGLRCSLWRTATTSCWRSRLPKTLVCTASAWARFPWYVGGHASARSVFMWGWLCHTQAGCVFCRSPTLKTKPHASARSCGASFAPCTARRQSLAHAS